LDDAVGWLEQAARHYDDPRHGLARAARVAATGGFSGGAEWMREALRTLRGTAPAARTSFHALGIAKYALASGAAGAAALAAAAVATALATGLDARSSLAAIVSPAIAFAVAIGAFYGVEARLVFAFPMALDGSGTPLRDSHRLVRRTMSASRATASVLRIAASMVIGGFAGRGFLRSWCIGCLAVLLWHEQARAAAAGVGRPEPAR
jgi:hypothetical protein